MDLEDVKVALLNNLTEQSHKFKGVDEVNFKINLNIKLNKHGYVYMLDSKTSKWILITNDYFEEKKEVKKKPHYSNSELTDHLSHYVEECFHQKTIPSSQDYRRQYSTPSYNLYIRRFGSWNNALNETGLIDEEGLPHPKQKKYNREELLKILKEFVEENIDDLKQTNFNKSNKTPTIKPYKRYFGSYEEALKTLIDEGALNKDAKSKLINFLFKKNF